MSDHSRGEKVHENLSRFFDSLQEKHHLSDTEIGCMMLIIQAIGKFNLQPQEAGKYIRQGLQSGEKSFSYAGRHFTVTADDFAAFNPNMDAFLESYKTFHRIHNIPNPSRMIIHSEDEKRFNVGAIVEAVIRYSRE